MAKKFNRKQAIAYLKSFWEQRDNYYDEFVKQERTLEDFMSWQGIQLEFFYNDEGQCCGIGARDYKDRKKFPLIHDQELE